MKNYPKLIALAAFALAVATSAQAMSPLQSDDIIAQVRAACGAPGLFEDGLAGLLS